ncbi:MAG: FmdB family zinc ribbon protein [Myxococcota bacterium]
MPFYEYQCEKCSEIFEIFIRNGEKIPESCEICGGKLHKIISVSSFQLKGSGWYLTDYARKNSPTTEKVATNNSKGNHKKDSDKGSATEQVRSAKSEKGVTKTESIVTSK